MQATKDQQLQATLSGLIGIGPRDELEGMLAAQMIAVHNATMECHRRAMLGEQTFEGRKEALTQANKLSRTYTTLLEALNRHRGKGQQKVTIEHVHVHAGGQAIVGAVEPPGGVANGNQRQPHAKSISHAPVTPLWGEDPERSPCRSPAMPNGRCRMHGGSSPGAPRGPANGNYRNGRFTCEAVAERRQLAAWIRAMAQLAQEVE